MGCLSSRPDVIDGALIVDSVVISNSRIRFNDNVISIPMKSLDSGETSVVNIDRKNGEVRITRGPLHGTLTHDALVEDITTEDHHRKSPRRKSTIYRESYNL